MNKRKTTIAIGVLLLLVAMGMFVKVEFFGNYNALLSSKTTQTSVQKTIHLYGGDHIRVTEEKHGFPPARYITFRMTLGQYILLSINEPNYRKATTFNVGVKE